MNSNGEQLVIIIIKLYVWKCDTHVCAVRILDEWMDARERDPANRHSEFLCPCENAFILLCIVMHAEAYGRFGFVLHDFGRLMRLTFQRVRMCCGGCAIFSFIQFMAVSNIQRRESILKRFLN